MKLSPTITDKQLAALDRVTAACKRSNAQARPADDAPTAQGVVPCLGPSHRRKQIVGLKEKGRDFRQIGQILGIPTARAWQLYKANPKELHRIYVTQEQPYGLRLKRRLMRA